ncbi:MAG: terminase family protein [Alphaproteobacteria bacterium]
MKKLLRVWGDVRVWYRPHGKQKAFHAAGVVASERLFLAGNRVGKTLAGAAEMGFHLTGLYPDWWEGVRFDGPVDAWAASVTREATRDIVQVAYLGRGKVRGVLPKRLVLDVVMKGTVAKAADVVRVRHVSGGISQLGFKSFDQGRESFQGTARHVVHLDEEPTLEVYEECLLRTMTVGGHMMLTMTPLMGVTPMVRHFVEHEGEIGKAVVRAGWADAVHLKPADVGRLRASLRPHEVSAREHGTPSLGRGAVYPVAEEEIAVERFEIPSHFKRCVGVDFGWANPTAAVWLAYDADNDVVYVVDCYVRAEATPAEHAAEVLGRGAWIPAVCDPAGQAANARDGVSLVEMYAAAGVRFTPADNSVEAGLMQVLERMRSGRLKVFADLAPWWGEFRSYQRDGKGKIVKRNDHLMDAMRYAVVSGLGLAVAEGDKKGVVRKRKTGWMGA